MYSTLEGRGNGGKTTTDLLYVADMGVGPARPDEIMGVRDMNAYTYLEDTLARVALCFPVYADARCAIPV